MQVNSGAGFSVGDELRLQLGLPDGSSYEARGRVLEVSGELARLAVEARAPLLEFLASSALKRRSGRLHSPKGGRRQHDRFDTFLKARFRSYQQLVDEYVTNISRGGMFVRTQNPPPMDARVAVQVRFPDGRLREVLGKVVRVVSPAAAAESKTSSGAGIAFEEDPAFGAAIEVLLEQYLARNPRLLVVDDSPFFLRVLSEALMENGFELMSAENGYEASRLLMHHLYDLDGVVLDLQMPGLDGRTLIQRIARLGHEMELRVVVVSGEDEAKLNTLVAKGDADEAIPKRIPLSEMVERIRKAVALRQEDPPQK
ncbi:MAG: response regulator [Myxococcales bacterium]|nr:response regulator [Myxococcales bacterium]